MLVDFWKVLNFIVYYRFIVIKKKKKDGIEKKRSEINWFI